MTEPTIKEMGIDLKALWQQIPMMPATPKKINRWTRHWKRRGRKK